MKYDINLTAYQGPIEKLLELIEARELEIAEISLATVTDDFLKYLEEVSKDYAAREKEAAEGGEKAVRAEEYMRLLSDFIVIASRLVLIKSKSLIPDVVLNEDEEAQVKELENRLRRYRELKPAIKVIAQLWRKGEHEFGREYFLHVRGLLLAIRAQEGKENVFFYPGGQLELAQLVESIKKVLALSEATVAEEKVAREKIISLEAKIKEIMEHMRNIKESTFHGLAKGASRSEVVVAFLAILHLAREQLVRLEQENSSSDIIIRQIT
ncbi:MAG: segregation/condensation protein A [Candidatus Liptonbacteria bacterium]